MANTALGNDIRKQYERAEKLYMAAEGRPEEQEYFRTVMMAYGFVLGKEDDPLEGYEEE